MITQKVACIRHNSPNYKYNYNYIGLYRGKSPITDPLLIPTPCGISVTIRDIKK